MDVRKEVKSGGIKPIRSLGQNFLVDSTIAAKIVEAAELTKQDDVIEIGPGMGALTGFLCQQARTVTAVEIDKYLIPKISELMLPYDNFRLIHADILKVSMQDVLPERFRMNDVFAVQAIRSGLKIISNLPYYITTPVIMRFFEEGIKPEKMVFMMQREVADRLVAKPSTKAYGALTVIVNYYAAPSRAFLVSPHCFVPQPDVDSSVVVLNVHETPPVELMDEAFFFKVVKAAFSQRRKTLINCLIHAELIAKDRKLAAELLQNVGLSENVRGEALNIFEFAKLSNEIFKHST